jgi:hypothetical protein
LNVTLWSAVASFRAATKQTTAAGNAQRTQRTRMFM